MDGRINRDDGVGPIWYLKYVSGSGINLFSIIAHSRN